MTEDDYVAVNPNGFAFRLVWESEPVVFKSRGKAEQWIAQQPEPSRYRALTVAEYEALNRGRKTEP